MNEQDRAINGFRMYIKIFDIDEPDIDMFTQWLENNAPTLKGSAHTLWDTHFVPNLKKPIYKNAKKKKRSV